LPQLLTSLKKHKDHPVLVVEGERNVEDALALGISATTCPCGAGKVHLVADELRDLLKGRKVVVVCDDDPVVPNLGFRPGVEHGKQVGEVLSDVVKALKVVRLFDDQRGCDLSNFVELLEGDVSERRMKIWKHLARFPLWENGLEPHYLFYAFEPFASRVERQQQQVQVKSVGPVGNAMEAFGVLSTNYLSVQQALMSGDMEALLEAMARLAVVTNKVGNDLTNGQ
jgi:hypothetical protein